MSRLFILFLIALLPLRGWTVQHMGLDMHAPLVAVSQVKGTEMGEECALHMQMAAKGYSTQVQQGGPHTGCQSCDICMPIAALDDMAGLALNPEAQAIDIRHPGNFASADPARCAKPPIS